MDNVITVKHLTLRGRLVTQRLTPVAAMRRLEELEALERENKKAASTDSGTIRVDRLFEAAALAAATT